MAGIQPRRTSSTRFFANAAAILAIVVVLVFFLLPIAYLFAVSFKTPGEVTSSVFWPYNPTTDNWHTVTQAIPIFRYLINSVLTASFSALGSLLIAMPAAYAINRYRVGGNALSAVAIGMYVAPPIVTLLPLFFLLQKIGLLHSLVGITLIYSMMNVPVALWLLLGFLHRVPKEIDQAAAMDGAGVWRTLVSVILPIMVPGIVSTAIVCAVLTYNEFLFAFFMTDNDSRTMPIALALFAGDQIVNYGQMAAASLIGIVPVAMAILIFQRWLVGGLTAGAEK